jgi:hypothetical protein
MCPSNFVNKKNISVNANQKCQVFCKLKMSVPINRDYSFILLSCKDELRGFGFFLFLLTFYIKKI